MCTPLERRHTVISFRPFVPARSDRILSGLAEILQGFFKSRMAKVHSYQDSIQWIKAANPSEGLKAIYSALFVNVPEKQND